jgi:PAS domain S-box-containing protein
MEDGTFMTQTPDTSGVAWKNTQVDASPMSTPSEQARLGQLSLEVSLALTRGETLREMLSACTDALVRYLDAAFARIWILNEDEGVLELQASSGMYTHLNGQHARVPVGALKIGAIAAERMPHLTNAVLDDPRVGDHEWANREGMVAFAGYPLLVKERLIGVMAMFARHQLDEATLQAMAVIANGIALGIERLRMQEERARLLESERTARIEAEAAHERLVLSQRAGRIGSFEWDDESNQVSWTPELEILYGVPPGGFEGNSENWSKRIHPDDLQKSQEQLQAAIANNAPYNIEYRAVWPDGSVHWLAVKGEVTEFDAQGRPLHLVGVNIDITERKEAEQRLAAMYQELQELNATLEARVAQRTEALNQLNLELQRSNQELQDFAYVASHDLQEPLRKIQAFGNLLEEEYGVALGSGKVYLDRMRSSATRMRTLIDDLLTFSRVTTKAAPFVQVDLTVIARQVVDDLEARMEDTPSRVIMDDLPSIEADPGQMYQLFQNLIGNALKFHKPGVEPRVRIFAEVRSNPEMVSSIVEREGDNRKTEKGDETVASSSPAEQQCILYIEDNGIGFDEKYLDRIFTVFQRLHGKNEYEGTGVGLAVVRKIVERHGGTVTARSAVGEGTTFIVTLPLVQQRVKEDDNV